MSCSDFPTKADALRFKKNADSTNEFVTSTSDTFVDQDGGTHNTIHGNNALAESQRVAIENAAKSQRDHLESTFSNQFAFKHVGNISDHVGEQLTDTDKLNAYQYPDDSGEWYGAIQGQNFPITIPANPATSGEWALVNGVTKDFALNTFSNTNLISNHNFLIPTPDSTVTPPDATPRDYAADTQIFSGVFAGSTGVQGLTYSNGYVSFTGGDFYFSALNSNGLEYVSDFTASVADFDGKPRADGVSYALVGNEYHVTVVAGALTGGGLGSVKFEQGSVATGHEVRSLSAANLSDYTDIVYKASGGNTAVENMIDGVPIIAPPDATISTGGTMWRRNGGSSGTIYDFTPISDVFASDFGASTLLTDAQNKTIVESIIDQCINSLYGSTVVVKNEYGYVFTDSTTHLNKSNPDSSCVVIDTTHGPNTNIAGLYPYGGQYRRWMFAEGVVEQNESGTGIGNTAGNSTLIHGLWNPALVMNVNGENIDNRRVKIFFGALGTNYWSAGQGNLTIPYDASDPNEISGSNEERRRHWNVSGKTNGIGGYQTKWVIRQDSGHQGWNIAEAGYSYHFADNPNSIGTLTYMIENRESQSTQLVLKTGDEQVNILQDNGANGRLLIKNTAGDIICQIKANGELVGRGGVSGGSYTTTERNALSVSNGTMVFDTDLGKPFWYQSPVWRDATGTAG